MDENGVFKPREPINLDEHRDADVVIPRPVAPDSDDPTEWETVEELLGFIANAPADLAERHDCYLYDRSKA